MRREWAPADERLGSRVKTVCQKSRHECHKPEATQTGECVWMHIAYTRAMGTTYDKNASSV